MKIDENYSIKTDKCNVILCYKNEGQINPNTGKPKKTYNEWYYKDMADALNAYMNKTINRSESIPEITSQIQLAMSNIELVVSKLQL
jgi:hypothetical protein